MRNKINTWLIISIIILHNICSAWDNLLKKNDITHFSFASFSKILRPGILKLNLTLQAFLFFGDLGIKLPWKETRCQLCFLAAFLYSSLTSQRRRQRCRKSATTLSLTTFDCRPYFGGSACRLLAQSWVVFRSWVCSWPRYRSPLAIFFSAAGSSLLLLVSTPAKQLQSWLTGF